jgi:hypothetical protein
VETVDEPPAAAGETAAPNGEGTVGEAREDLVPGCMRGFHRCPDGSCVPFDLSCFGVDG